MMLKPNQLRDHLLNAVPQLQQNPERLSVTLTSGQIISTLASSLSFEYHYPLTLEVHDYGEDMDVIMLPLLAWLRVNQPDMMTSAEQRKTGLSFTLTPESDTTTRLTIRLALTERVIVRQEGDRLVGEHVGEPPLADNVARPTMLYINGKLVSSWT